MSCSADICDHGSEISGVLIRVGADGLAQRGTALPCPAQGRRTTGVAELRPARLGDRECLLGAPGAAQGSQKTECIQLASDRSIVVVKKAVTSTRACVDY